MYWLGFVVLEVSLGDYGVGGLRIFGVLGDRGLATGNGLGFGVPGWDSLFCH